MNEYLVRRSYIPNRIHTTHLRQAHAQHRGHRNTRKRDIHRQLPLSDQRKTSEANRRDQNRDHVPYQPHPKQVHLRPAQPLEFGVARVKDTAHPTGFPGREFEEFDALDDFVHGAHAFVAEDGDGVESGGHAAYEDRVDREG